MEDIAENKQYFVGPLNINRQTRQADTVMGTKLLLGENEFDALDKLAEHEGEIFTLEQLNAAHEELGSLMKQVNSKGEGFMWIEYEPEAGYVFKTRWGRAWYKNKAFII